jgi:hypothetical protein
VEPELKEEAIDLLHARTTLVKLGSIYLGINRVECAYDRHASFEDQEFSALYVHVEKVVVWQSVCFEILGKGHYRNFQ